MLKKKTLFWYFWGKKVYVYKIHFMTKHNLNSNICILATVALVKYERTNKGMCVRGFEWSLFCLNFERIGKGKQYICIFLRENLWAVFLDLRFLWTFSIDHKSCQRFVKQCFLSLKFSDTFIQMKITGFRNTIFRAFASGDKNGPTFVTITSAAFDPEKTTFSSDNKWWSRLDWRPSVMFVFFCISTCICALFFVLLTYMYLYSTLCFFMYFRRKK